MYNLRKEVFFSIIAQILIMLIGLVINKLLSNNLNVEDYGLFNIIKRTATIISFVLLGGMGIAIPKYVPQSIDYTERFKFIISGLFLVIVISVFFLIIVIIFEDSANRNIFNGGNNIIISFFYGISITLLSFLYSYYRGRDKILLFNLVQIFAQILILILTLLYSKTVFYYIKYSIVINFLFFLIFFIYEVFKNYKICKVAIKNGLGSYIKELWNYGYSRMIGDLFLFSLTTIPLLIINKKFSGSDVAFFSVGITLTSLISPIFSYIGVILLPKVSQAISEKKNNEVYRIVNKFIKMYVFISILVILFIYLFDDLLIKLFFSESYLEARGIVFWVSLSILPNSLYLLLRNPIDAISKIPFNTINLFISCFFGFALMWYSNTPIYIGKSYLLLQILLGSLSFLTWQLIKKKKYV